MPYFRPSPAISTASSVATAWIGSAGSAGQMWWASSSTTSVGIRSRARRPQRRPARRPRSPSARPDRRCCPCRRRARRRSVRGRPAPGSPDRAARSASGRCRACGCGRRAAAPAVRVRGGRRGGHVGRDRTARSAPAVMSSSASSSSASLTGSRRSTSAWAGACEVREAHADRGGGERQRGARPARSRCRRRAPGATRRLAVRARPGSPGGPRGRSSGRSRSAAGSSAARSARAARRSCTSCPEPDWPHRNVCRARPRASSRARTSGACTSAPTSRPSAPRCSSAHAAIASGGAGPIGTPPNPPVPRPSAVAVPSSSGVRRPSTSRATISQPVICASSGGSVSTTANPPGASGVPSGASKTMLRPSADAAVASMAESL